MIIVYCQYIMAKIRLRMAIARGYEGKMFSNGLFPKTEEMLRRNGWTIYHRPAFFGGGTVVRKMEGNK